MVMKRTFKQTLIWKDTGKVLASRELEFDEDAETYHRPVFVAHLMDREDEFLKENLEVMTEEKA
jgi:hypothetical protein